MADDGGNVISRAAVTKRAFNFNSPFALMATEKRCRLAGVLARSALTLPPMLARVPLLRWPTIVAPHLLSTPNGARVLCSHWAVTARRGAKRERITTPCTRNGRDQSLAGVTEQFHARAL